MSVTETARRLIRRNATVLDLLRAIQAATHRWVARMNFDVADQLCAFAPNSTASMWASAALAKCATFPLLASLTQASGEGPPQPTTIAGVLFQMRCNRRHGRTRLAYESVRERQGGRPRLQSPLCLIAGDKTARSTKTVRERSGHQQDGRRVQHRLAGSRGSQTAGSSRAMQYYLSSLSIVKPWRIENGAVQIKVVRPCSCWLPSWDDGVR
jgi:hypothetical protein